MAVVQKGSKEQHGGRGLKLKYSYFQEYSTSKLYLSISVTNAKGICPYGEHCELCYLQRNRTIGN